MLDNLVFSGRNLFIIYAALTTNFLRPLIPCNTARFVENSMLFRHLIAFMGIVFFSMISEADIATMADIIPIIISAVLVYGWFMISSKMTANWWIPLVFLIAIIYTVNAYREHSKALTRDVHTYMEYTEYAAIALSVLVTLGGFFIYVGEKKLEYRGKFDYTTFILGSETCKNTPTKTAYWDSLKAAFFVAPGSGSGSSGSGSGQRGGFVGEDSIAPVSSFDFKASVLE
jgi:hypothetical protein